jgi:hypothetical protein
MGPWESVLRRDGWDGPHSAAAAVGAPANGPAKLSGSSSRASSPGPRAAPQRADIPWRRRGTDIEPDPLLYLQASRAWTARADRRRTVRCLKEAGASDEKARAAAQALANYDNRFSKIEADLLVLKWMVGAILAGVASLAIRPSSPESGGDAPTTPHATHYPAT